MKRKLKGNIGKTKKCNMLNLIAKINTFNIATDCAWLNPFIDCPFIDTTLSPLQSLPSLSAALPCSTL